jgi:acyl carrier protein
MADSVSEKVIAIIAEQAVLEPSDVSIDATLDELGIDSLGLVESIFAIEEAFDIQVPFNANEPDAERFRHLLRGLHRARGRKTDLGAIHPRDPAPMKRVVITGQGTINALGHDVPSTLEAMREGRCGIGPLELRDVERLSVRIGGQVNGL